MLMPHPKQEAGSLKHMRVIAATQIQVRLY